MLLTDVSLVGAENLARVRVNKVFEQLHVPVVYDEILVSADWTRGPSGDSVLSNAGLPGLKRLPSALSLSFKLDISHSVYRLP